MTELKPTPPRPATEPVSRLTRMLAHPALVSGLLAAATLAVFWPAVHHGFVSYDDPDYVTDNPHVKAGLSAEGVAWAFRTGHAGNWHPLTWLSHQLDVQLWGLNPAGHHLTSLLLHAANAVLLFLMLRRATLTSKVEHPTSNIEHRTSNLEPRTSLDLNPQPSTLNPFWACALVAGLFALHPLHVESVAWVAERKDVLSGFFFLLTLWAYVGYAEGRRQNAECRMQNAETARGPHSSFILHPSAFYLLSLAFFALGLMSKPMLVTLPFVLLLLDYWPLGRMRKEEGRMQNGEADHAPRTTHHAPRPTPHTRRFILHPLSFILWEKLPFFALAAASCVATVLVQKQAMQPLANLSLGARAGNAVVACARYLGKTFWPLNLATPYPHPGHWPPAFVLLAAVLVTGLTLSAVWLGRRYRFAFTGWFWFLGMLVPVIGLVQVGEQSMADRYTYLPLIGVFIIVAWGVAGLKGVSGLIGLNGLYKLNGLNGLNGIQGEGPLPCGVGSPAPFNLVNSVNPITTTLALLVLLACAVRTRDQLRCWRDSESLYRHAVAVSRGNFIAYYNLGSWLDREGRTDEALTNYFKAVEIQPRYPDPLNNIGCILAGRKQFAEAVPYFEAALRSKPDYVGAHENLAAAFRELGRFQEAIPHLQAVVKAKPQDTGALNSLGNALAGQGQYAEAAPYYEASLRAKPDQFAAHYGLANTLAKLGRADDAVAEYRLALQAQPDFAQAHNDLGIVLARQGRLEEAILELRAAVRSDPRTASFQLNLGRMLAARQDFGEAITCYQAALQLAPDNAVAHFNLGKALAAQGKTEEAIAHLTEALRLKPDYAPARQELQALGGQKP